MGNSRNLDGITGWALAFGVGAAVCCSAGTARADSTDSGPGPDPGAAATHAPGPAVRDRRSSGRSPDASAPRAVSAAVGSRRSTVPLPELARRGSPLPAAARAVAAVKAPSAGITVNPVVSFSDGVFFGQLNATSSRGLDMKYTPVGGMAGGSNGGKLSLGTNMLAPISAQGFTLLPYRTWDNLGIGKGTETWQVRVSEITPLDAALAKIPLIGAAASPIISALQKTPIVGTVLAPLIGTSVLATVIADLAAAPGTTPLSYTYKVASFDGTLISTNFFPAVGLTAGQTAPTVLNGPGLGQPGETDPYALCRDCANEPEKTAVGALRVAGYNAVTWDPRGEFNSGGQFQLDSPFYEGRDVSALISWAAADTPALLDAQGDPRIGMIGGSLGGGIQLSASGIDPRIEAITPDISWNSLNQSLYPSATFKTAYDSLLLLALVATKARINPQIYVGIATGVLFGRLSPLSQSFLGSNGPTVLLSKATAPTLLTQGTVDVLFPLNQSMANAASIIGNGTTAKVIWYCGGHGYCAYPVGPDQAATIRTDTLAWLDQYVARSGNPADAIPNFQWFDQLGNHYVAPVLPTDAGFNDRAPVTATNLGGRLGIVPLLGGSGPGAGPVPVNLGGGSPARNAINVPLTVPADSQVVGAPTLSFTYHGVGNSRAVFAQIVDDSTQLVLGQNVTPVPVTLDGKTHQVSIDLNDVVYTYGGTAPGNLTLQITSSAVPYENSSIGTIDISDVIVSLPNRSVPA